MTRDRRLTGRGVLFTLLAVFGIVFAVNGVFIAEAIGTFRGGDEQNPYLQGLDYNQTLDRHREQRELGWHAGLAAKRSGGHVELTLTVSSQAGAPVSGEHFLGELRHPADANLDKAFALKETAPGHYTASVLAIRRGAWDVIVKATDPRKPFEASRRIWLQ